MDPTALKPIPSEILKAFARTRNMFARFLKQEEIVAPKSSTVFDFPTYDYLPQEYRDKTIDEK